MNIYKKTETVIKTENKQVIVTNNWGWGMIEAGEKNVTNFQGVINESEL